MPKESEAMTQIELARLEKDNNFRVRSKMDVFAVLKKVMQKHTLVTLYLDQGNRFILTSILDINPERNEMTIDYGIDEVLNQSALSTGRLTFITSQDRIKVEFICNTIKKVNFEGREAFVVNFPDSLVRIQRRNYFRVPAPMTTALKCIVPLPSGHKMTTAEVALLDISGGGIAVIDHHPVVSFDPGNIFKNCHIVLPDIGTVTVTIQVKNIFEITLENGLVCMRVGCEFITLPTRMSAMIQRYVVKLEQMAIKN